MPQGDRLNSIAIEFDATRCLHVRSIWGGCSLCWDSCPTGAIQPEGKSRIPVLDKSLCTNCGQCLSACPLDTFSSPHFNERQLLARVKDDVPIRLRCFVPYGDITDIALADEYQLGTCLASLTPGALFELAFERPCTLTTNRCTSCAMFERVGKTLQCNEETAYSLLADWGRETNLRETMPLFLPETTNAWVQDEGDAATDANDASHHQTLESLLEHTYEDSSIPGLTYDSESERETSTSKVASSVKSSIRALFHDRRKREESKEFRQRRGELRLQAKRTHIPYWKQRLEEHWRTHGPAPHSPSYFWPLLMVNDHRCRGCGVCMQLCPTGAIHQTLVDGTFSYTFVPGHCIDCGLCIASCVVHALDRSYEPSNTPFDEQVRFSRPAVSCPRCGLPVLGGREGDYCPLCIAEPKVESIIGRIREQMGVGNKTQADTEARERTESGKGEGGRRDS